MSQSDRRAKNIVNIKHRINYLLINSTYSIYYTNIILMPLVPYLGLYVQAGKHLNKILNVQKDLT